MVLERYRPAWLHRCTQCGLSFQTPESAEHLRALYSRDYFDTYGDGRTSYGSDERGRRYQSRVRLRLLSRHTRPPGRLMEFGAAGGQFLLAARAAGYDVFGVEPEPSMAARAQEVSGAPVLIGFLEDVDLPESALDVACGWHVVEHIPDPVAALARVRSALRVGGHLFIEVPNFESAESRRRGLDWPYLDLPHHVNQFGPGSLSRAVEAAGLQVRSVETVAMFSYFRPSVALRPVRLARRVRLSVRVRVPLGNTHPTRHDLLRVVARRVS
jgi:SAM-dependent methyltransferase